jgi:hypothetical protein
MDGKRWEVVLTVVVNYGDVAVQVVVGGEVPMVGDSYGVLDGAQKMTASP